jgi:hypothetical protein
MQISASTQNTYTAVPMVELSKTTPTVSADTAPQKTDSINKSAYNYFDLGEDISPYTQTDPVQEKTNQELVTYLTGIMNNKTPEGKKNLEAFDTSWYAADVTMQKNSPPFPLQSLYRIWHNFLISRNSKWKWKEKNQNPI